MKRKEGIAVMQGGYPNRQNPWPEDLKTTPPGVRTNKKKKFFFSYMGRREQGRKKQEWGNRVRGGVIRQQVRGSLMLRPAHSPGRLFRAWRKEKGVTKFD